LKQIAYCSTFSGWAVIKLKILVSDSLTKICLKCQNLRKLQMRDLQKKEKGCHYVRGLEFREPTKEAAYI
jgi:hypothetical protein